MRCCAPPQCSCSSRSSCPSPSWKSRGSCPRESRRKPLAASDFLVAVENSLTFRAVLLDRSNPSFRDEVQKSLPHHRADPVLENSLEILNPGLHRGHYPSISLHRAGWFKRLFKQAVSAHRPINPPLASSVALAKNNLELGKKDIDLPFLKWFHPAARGRATRLP